MLSANQVRISIQNTRLLDGVSVSIAPGEMTALIGPNGAGKTTLLKALSGDLGVDRGSVQLDEKPLSSYCPRTLARRRAVMPQHSALSFSFAVQEVVDMGRAPHLEHAEASQNAAIVRQAMEVTEVSHLIGRDYTTLSGGEKQRVHLARVLAQVWSSEPFGERYLLLDEPTSSLDIHHQCELLDFLKGFARSGVGILIIAHDLNLASMFADRVIMMKQGKVEAEGTPGEVYTRERLNDVFQLNAHIGLHPDNGRPFLIPAALSGAIDPLSAIDETNFAHEFNHSNNKETYHDEPARTT